MAAVVRRIAGLVLAIGVVAFAAAARGESVIRVCTEDDDSYPRQFRDRPGLVDLLLARVEARAQVRFVVHRLRP